MTISRFDLDDFLRPLTEPKQIDRAAPRPFKLLVHPKDYEKTVQVLRDLGIPVNDQKE